MTGFFGTYIPDGTALVESHGIVENFDGLQLVELSSRGVVS